MGYRWPLVLILVVVSTACAPVKPWQKGNLAKRHMAFEPQPLDSKLERHIEASKEGSFGGYGVGAGGCGCN